MGIPGIPVPGCELGCFLEGIMDTRESLMEIGVVQWLLVCIRVSCFVTLCEFDKYAFEHFGVEFVDGVNVVMCVVPLITIIIRVIA